LEGWGSLARQPGGLDQVERFHALVEQRNQLSEQGLRDEAGDFDFVSIRDLGSGVPDVVERRFVDRVDQLEQRLALTDDPDPSTDLDPSDTLDPDPDLNDEMDIS
jgi:hypothetical protein